MSGEVGREEKVKSEHDPVQLPYPETGVYWVKMKSHLDSSPNHIRNWILAEFIAIPSDGPTVDYPWRIPSNFPWLILFLGPLQVKTLNVIVKHSDITAIGPRVLPPEEKA